MKNIDLGEHANIALVTLRKKSMQKQVRCELEVDTAKSSGALWPELLRAPAEVHHHANKTMPKTQVGC